MVFCVVSSVSLADETSASGPASYGKEQDLACAVDVVRLCPPGSGGTRRAPVCLVRNLHAASNECLASLSSLGATNRAAASPVTPGPSAASR